MFLLDAVITASLALTAVLCALRPSRWRARGRAAAITLALASSTVAMVDGRWQTALGFGVALGTWAGLGVAARRRQRLGSRGTPTATRRSALAGAVLVALGAASCAALFWMMPVTALPAPTGPFAVGTTGFELVDPTRPMGAGTDRQAPRRITVRAWYPTADRGGTPARPYFTREEADLFGREFGRMLGLPGFFWNHLRLVATHSHEDMALAAHLAPFPVVIFNHGYWSFPTQNTALLEQLASHGYLVFSLTHPGDSSGVRFSNHTQIGVDQTRVQRILEQEEAQAALNRYLTSVDPGERYQALRDVPTQSRGMQMLESIDPWLQDTQRLLDRLGTQSLSGLAGELLAGADTGRIGLMGMSWGGSMAGTICLVDRRCKVAVNLDGMVWDWRLIDATLPVPLLMLQSDTRLMFPGLAGPAPARQDFMYERLANAGDRADIHRILLSGTTHADFTDFTLFVRAPLRTRTVRLGVTPGERVFAAQQDLVLSFFDTYLRGRDVGFPHAALQRHPDARRHDVGYVKVWYHQQGPGHTAPAVSP